MSASSSLGLFTGPNRARVNQSAGTGKSLYLMLSWIQ